MRRHVNPYRILDPKNLLEVTENSSHPELGDSKRIYRFKAYTFHSAAQVLRFFDSEGLRLQDFWISPYQVPGTDGFKTTIVEITDRKKNKNSIKARSI